MNKKVLYGALLLMCCILCSFQKEDFAESKRILRECIKSLGAITTPEGKKAYHMSVTVTTAMNGRKGIPNTSAKIDMFMSAEQLHYVSDELITYQDNKDAFAILPRRRTIVWSQGIKRAGGKEQMQIVTSAQDTLVSLSKVTSCKTVDENGVPTKIIVMDPPRAIKEKLKISRMEYAVDEKNKEIKRATTYFLPTEDVVMQSVVYHEINLNYKDPKLSQSAYQQVFNGAGKLNEKYKGYQLIDKRN